MGYKTDTKKSNARGNNHMIVKPNYPHTVINPSWDTEKFAPTIFKPFGVPTADGRSYQFYRQSPDMNDFGDWIKLVPVFEGGTVNRVKFIAGNLDPLSGAYLRPEQGGTKNMLDRLYKTIFTAKDSRPEWKSLQEGRKGMGPAIGRVQWRAYVQGILHTHKGAICSPLKYPVVLSLSKSATTALEECLNEEVEGYEGDPDDMVSRFKAGDLLNPDGGKLLRFWCSKTNPPSQHQAASFTQPRRGEASAANQTPYFKCDLIDRGDMIPDLGRTDDGKLLFESNGHGFIPWEDLMADPLSDEQMVRVLAEAFEDQPELIEAAFGETGYLSDAWYSRRSRVTFAGNVNTRSAPKASVPEDTLEDDIPMDFPKEIPPAPVKPKQNSAPAWGPPTVNRDEDEDGNVQSKQFRGPSTFAPPPGVPVPGIPQATTASADSAESRQRAALEALERRRMGRVQQNG